MMKKKKSKLDPGSYAVVNHRDLDPESPVTCEILGFRGGVMLVRAPDGTELALNPSSANVLEIKEVKENG
jgi:hypothetical protein